MCCTCRVQYHWYKYDPLAAGNTIVTCVAIPRNGSLRRPMECLAIRLLNILYIPSLILSIMRKAYYIVSTKHAKNTHTVLHLLHLHNFIQNPPKKHQHNHSFQPHPTCAMALGHLAHEIPTSSDLTCVKFKVDGMVTTAKDVRN